MEALAAWFRSLQERERRVLMAGAAVVAVFLVLGLFSLDRGVARAQARLTHRQQDLAWMRSVAPQLAA
ncbi:MAG: type II secretion system protein GspM, partial [Steroidobacteraceae bacterium]